jgi:hypothetical protein
VRSLRVLVEIRDGIVDLVPAGTRISDEVNELMDIPHIEERLKARAFDWDDSKSLIGSIVSIVMRTQHPSRTENTKSEWKKVGKEMLDATVSEQPRAYCNALEFLLNCISKMRVDAANMRYFFKTYLIILIWGFPTHMILCWQSSPHRTRHSGARGRVRTFQVPRQAQRWVCVT